MLRPMDSFTFAVSVFTIATVATQLGNAFLNLRRPNKAILGRLDALNKEVVDIESAENQASVFI